MSKASLTRANILQQAFELIYRQGYQGTSIDDIIARTQVTKGAFFYHFRNKEEMGLALINELMYEGLLPYMKNILERDADIRENLYGMLENLLLNNTLFDTTYGCPAVNLIEEMAPLNKPFNLALSRIMKQWHAAIRAAVEQAQAAKSLAASHSADDLATYIISNYAGIRNLGKLMGKPAYQAFLKEFKKYLQQLN